MCCLPPPQHPHITKQKALHLRTSISYGKLQDLSFYHQRRMGEIATNTKATHDHKVTKWTSGRREPKSRWISPAALKSASHLLLSIRAHHSLTSCHENGVSVSIKTRPSAKPRCLIQWLVPSSPYLKITGKSLFLMLINEAAKWHPTVSVPFAFAHTRQIDLVSALLKTGIITTLHSLQHQTVGLQSAEHALSP